MNPKQKRWTHAEVDYLHAFVDQCSAIEMAQHLQRPVQVVLAMLNQFGLVAKINRYDWTPEQVRYLQQYWHKLSRNELANDLNCTLTAVKRKGASLGLKKSGKQRVMQGNGVYTYWTPELDQFLRDNYRKLSTRQLAKCMGKDRREIQKRAQTIGIHEEWVDPTVWSPAEDQYLLDNWPAKSQKEIAIALNRSYRAVKCRIILYTGIEKIVLGDGVKKGKWTPEEKQYLIDNYSTKCLSSLSKQLTRRRDTVWVMVRKLNLTRTDEQRKLIAQSEEALTDSRILFQLCRDGRAWNDNRELFAQAPGLINLKRGEILLKREIKKLTINQTHG